jgi:nucleotide-binding universal stress UspA family protein
VQGFLDEPVRQFTPGDDIAATLARHGVKVETHAFAAMRGSVREELAAQALDFGADLCVMGCYGHSRLRERILGGVSRSMLRDIPFPLLLSN